MFARRRLPFTIDSAGAGGHGCMRMQRNVIDVPLPHGVG